MKTVSSALAHFIVGPALGLIALACGLYALACARNVWQDFGYFGWELLGKGVAKDVFMSHLGGLEIGGFACLLFGAAATALWRASERDSGPQTA